MPPPSNKRIFIFISFFFHLILVAFSMCFRFGKWALNDDNIMKSSFPVMLFVCLFAWSGFISSHFSLNVCTLFDFCCERHIICHFHITIFIHNLYECICLCSTVCCCRRCLFFPRSSVVELLARISHLKDIWAFITVNNRRKKRKWMCVNGTTQIKNVRPFM